jgi:D-glycero-alpha-D-manno-heptose-7-phosphate kinase
LITRTPLRVSLGGGGTDLPSYYREFGGLVISAAITKYVYIGINRTFTDDYFLKYAELERVRSVDDVKHPIIREALTLHAVGPSVEIVSLADIPSGTGLGSSGTFAVGLLKALHAFKREHIVTGALAEEACHLEIDRLGRAVGKQDQYIAAFGGLTRFEFCAGGQRVAASHLERDAARSRGAPPPVLHGLCARGGLDPRRPEGPLREVRALDAGEPPRRREHWTPHRRGAGER